MAWEMTDEELLARYACGERNFAGVVIDRGADLERAVLRNVNLRGAYFDNASFFRADLTDSDLGGIFLSECRLDYAIMQGVNLTAACVDSSTFTKADLQRTELLHINASGADFGHAIIGGCFEEAVLFCTSFYKARFVLHNRCIEPSDFIWTAGSNVILRVTLPNGDISS